MTALLMNKLKQQSQQNNQQQISVFYNQTAELFTRFQNQLEKFAQENLHKIDKDVELRQSFSNLCQELNIDPLSSSSSIFSKMIGDYYYRLAIKMINYLEINKNVNVNKFIEQFNSKLQNKKNMINKDDIIKTVKVINEISPGIQIIQQSNQDIIVFIDLTSNEIDQQIMKLLNNLSGKNKCVFKKGELDLLFQDQNTQVLIDQLINKQIVAVDYQNGGYLDPDYYFLSLC